MGSGLHKGILALMSLLFLFLFRGCYEEVSMEEEADDAGIERVLSFDQMEGMVDTFESVIYFTIPAQKLSAFSPEVDFHGYSSISMDQKELREGEVNELGPVEVNTSYQILAKKGDYTDTFKLFFTTLPLIHITAYQDIQDEPKVLSRMVMHYYENSGASPIGRSFETFSGIEIRGGSAMRYPKKSYGLELWENVGGKDYSASLLGMAYMEDWILDAMYIDELRMRNKISFELWKKMSHPPAEDQKDYLIPGIECRMVELVLNNRYHGIYSLNEKLDERLLQYGNDQDKQGGVLYKAIEWANGATLFETYNSEPPEDLYWDGWEQVFPESYYNWNPLSELRKLIVTADDEEFEQRIGSMIDLDNVVDYYLFVNLIGAFDNAGKNTYLARYTDQSRFFIVPWDMDGSWGIWWNGEKANYEGLIENQLFNRLQETNAGDFNHRLSSAWDLYRSTLFEEDSLIIPIQEYQAIWISSGAIQRENKRWEEVSIDPQSEYEHISEWLEERLDYLDERFDD